MDNKKKYELALLIERHLKSNFSGIHFSGNLMNTIKVYKTKNGYAIEIPAQVYDIDKYKKDKVIVPLGVDSYAEAVNQEGGFSGVHKNYVELAINNAIKEWMGMNKIKGKVTNA